MTKVVVTAGTDVIQTLELALDKLGGIKQFFKKDYTVFIKPDLELPLGPPTTIQPLILGHIVKIFHDLGAKSIYIGSNPFDGVSTEQIVKLLGLDYCIQNLGGTFLQIEKESYTKVSIEDPIFFESIQVPDKLLQSDLFVSLVAPRTDMFGIFSLALKNYFGLLNDVQKQKIFQTGRLEGLVDYFKAFPPNLIIWDAWNVGNGQSIFNQKALPYNLILTSTDLIAGDSIMNSLMGHDPEQNKILKLAADRGLGTISMSKINIIGENLAEHQKSIPLPSPQINNPSKCLDIIEGEPCHGCQICLQYFLDFLLYFIDKDLKEFGGFTCFIGKNLLNQSYNLKSGVIVFGDCAISHIKSMKLESKIKNKKYLFKFSGCPPLNLRLLEKFCLYFKEWLPSLEIIEEFIRRWTIGRRFRAFQTT